MTRAQRLKAMRRANLAKARAARAEKRAARRVEPAIDTDWFEQDHDTPSAVASAMDDFTRVVEEFWTNFGKRLAEQAREALNGT